MLFIIRKNKRFIKKEHIILSFLLVILILGLLVGIGINNITKSKIISQLQLADENYKWYFIETDSPVFLTN